MGFIGLALLALTQLANASEFFYIPPAGHAAATLRGGYRRTFLQDDAKGSSNITINGLEKLGLEAVHSFDGQISVGVLVSYTDLTRKLRGTGSLSGFDPLVFEMRGRYPTSAGRILYGADLSAGLEKGKLNTSGSYNRTFGDQVDGLNNAFTFRPMVGFESKVDQISFGLMTRFDLFKAHSEVNLISDGNSFAAKLSGHQKFGVLGFFEYWADPVLIGVDLEWVKYQTFKIKVESERLEGLSYTVMHADLYARYDIRDVGAVIPTITWNTTALADTSENIDDVRYSLAFRRTF